MDIEITVNLELTVLILSKHIVKHALPAKQSPVYNCLVPYDDTNI